MDAQTFHAIAIRYTYIGKSVSRSYTILGTDPRDTYTISDGAGSHTMHEDQFLEDAKRNGCYHKIIVSVPLHITSYIQAQEQVLLEGIPGWESGKLKQCLADLAAKDIVLMTLVSSDHRTISLASIPTGLGDHENELTILLAKYQPHS